MTWTSDEAMIVPPAVVAYTAIVGDPAPDCKPKTLFSLREGAYNPEREHTRRPRQLRRGRLLRQ